MLLSNRVSKNLIVQSFKAFCLCVLPFYIRDKNRELALRFILVFIVYVSSKLSSVKMAVLTFSLPVKSVRPWPSPCLVLSCLVCLAPRRNDHAGCHGKREKPFIKWRENFKTLEVRNIKLKLMYISTKDTLIF